MTFSPGLIQLRDWARQKQTEITVPVHERALWKQIADEIDDFTGRSLTPEPEMVHDGDLFGGAK